MTNPAEAPKSIYHQAFTRDGYSCVYCGKDILETLDTFAASHLDHLKPRRAGGALDAVVNCVTACAVCNSMKGGFDPWPEGPITEANFASAVQVARAYITDKRQGTTPCSYVRDYEHWLQIAGRKPTA